MRDVGTLASAIVATTLFVTGFSQPQPVLTAASPIQTGQTASLVWQVQIPEAKIHYYSISGSTETELRAQLVQWF